MAFSAEERNGMKRLLYFLLGLTAYLSLLCSIAASAATNEGLMTQGFLQFSQTAHLNVSATRYGAYAHGICDYLNGKTPVTQVADPASGRQETAFSDKENAHMADVKGIVTGLKVFRWVGGGAALAALGCLYFFGGKEKGLFLARAVRGFALSAFFLLALATALAAWGAVNFDGLFVTFHRLSFANDLWLLNPQTDLLVALMPLQFFIWYAGEMLKAMLPVLCMMALMIAAWLHLGKTQKGTETK